MHLSCAGGRQRHLASRWAFPHSCALWQHVCIRNRWASRQQGRDGSSCHAPFICTWVIPWPKKMSPSAARAHVCPTTCINNIASAARRCHNGKAVIAQCSYYLQRSSLAYSAACHRQRLRIPGLLYTWVVAPLVLSGVIPMGVVCSHGAPISDRWRPL